MTEKTVVVPSLALTYKGKFSLRAIEDVIRAYMRTTPYELADISHDISVVDNSKRQTIHFLFTRHPHNQEMCKLLVSVTAENAIVIIQKMPSGVHEFFDGVLKINMRATTYSNADEHKQTKALSYALSTLFRRFVYDSGTSIIGTEMKKYCYDLYDQLYGLVNMGKTPEGIHA